jgi:hypothetical protein
MDYGVGRQKIGFISQHDEEPCLFSIATGTALGPTQPRTDTVGFPSEGGKEMKWLRSADDYPPPSTAHVSMRGLYLYCPTRLARVMLISGQGISYLISILEC